MNDSEDQQVSTECCAKCDELFETVREPDGSGGYTAMTVCNSCFEYAVGRDEA